MDELAENKLHCNGPVLLYVEWVRVEICTEYGDFYQKSNYFFTRGMDTA